MKAGARIHSTGRGGEFRLRRAFPNYRKRRRRPRNTVLTVQAHGISTCKNHEASVIDPEVITYKTKAARIEREKEEVRCSAIRLSTVYGAAFSRFQHQEPLRWSGRTLHALLTNWSDSD